MRRSRVAVLAAVGVACAMLVGCGDEPSSMSAAHVTSSAERPRATEEEAAQGAPIVRRVATTLYAPIGEAAGDGNVAFSPLSIATVLGMARSGATGESAAQLDAFFGADGLGPDVDLHRAINGIDETIGSYAGPTPTDDDPDARIDVETANALWGQSGWTFEDPFIDQLKTAYDAGMWTADYENDPSTARAEINRWIAERTNERIPELLADGAVTTDTRLILANAVWFAAPWQQRLEALDQPLPFTLLDGTRVDADAIGDDVSVVANAGEGWRSVTLPYARGELAMTLIAPDEGRLGDVEAELDAVLAEATAPGEPQEVSLVLPAFDLDQRAALGDALQSLGVTAPFEEGTDDFAPMTAEGPLHLADVVHQATVTVDEDGTEAAAATAAVFETVGAAIEVDELTIDHPFLFVIHDSATATPLFLGRVTDPTVA